MPTAIAREFIISVITRYFGSRFLVGFWIPGEKRGCSKGMCPLIRLDKRSVGSAFCLIDAVFFYILTHTSTSSGTLHKKFLFLRSASCNEKRSKMLLLMLYFLRVWFLLILTTPPSTHGRPWPFTVRETQAGDPNHRLWAYVTVQAPRFSAVTEIFWQCVNNFLANVLAASNIGVFYKQFQNSFRIPF